ncbi:MAG: type II secretion system F family protein [Roseovarius sp.]|nr:type II secretion system F family protein [Roseovarius sp.]
MSLIIVYGLVFGAALLLADAALRILFAGQRRTKEINERLERLRDGTDQSVAYDKLLKDRWAGGGRSGLSVTDWFIRIYRQSGLLLSQERRIAYAIGVFVLAWIVSMFIVSDAIAQLVLAVPLGGAMIVLILLRLRARRIGRFVSQIPGAVDIIVRSLNAGHPINTAIALVSREMPDPIGSEFGTLSDQLTFGAELDSAMVSMVDRVGAEELNLLAVTISVQRGTGGSLSEVLGNLSKMVRDRGILRAKIKAISAEGRITAMIMAAFPFLLFFMIRGLVPSYFDPIWESGLGTPIVVGVLVWMAIGVAILYRLVKFDF